MKIEVRMRGKVIGFDHCAVWCTIVVNRDVYSHNNSMTVGLGFSDFVAYFSLLKASLFMLWLVFVGLIFVSCLSVSADVK